MQIIRKWASFAKKQKDPKQCFANLFAAQKDDFNRSVVLAAYYHAFREWPSLPPQFDSVVAVAQALWTRTTSTPLPTARSSAKGVCQDYDIVPMSDEARKQWKEHRDKTGQVYIGPRRVRTSRPEIGAGYPLHWTIG